jgi:hypothetical protein
MERLVLRTTAAVVGLVATGVGLAGVAAAAPASSPSPASSAPPSADSAPTPPSFSDAPVPLVFRPLDATDGLFGVHRGSMPTASTPDMGDRLPSIDVTPLPTRGGSDEEPATGPQAAS